MLINIVNFKFLSLKVYSIKYETMNKEHNKQIKVIDKRRRSRRYI